jgi:aryl sulfotransferase
MSLPANVTREYRNHTIDSTRWRAFTPRDGDVIVTTSYKSGTTWTLGLLHSLTFRHEAELPPYAEFWIDARFLPFPLEDQIAALEAQTHRRAIKSHLAADGLPIWENVKYIVVGRDPRDVFMSVVNHYDQFNDQAYQMLNETPGRVGPPIPRFDGDVRKLWQGWITRGSFAWESEGYPWWGNMHHAETWWAVRDRPNVLLVHYNDLKRDVQAELRRIAAWLGEELTDAEVEKVTARASLDAMRDSAIRVGDPLTMIFKDGAKGFFYKGTNERWRGVLTDADLELYEAAKRRVLSPECAAWLERGRRGATLPR